LSAFSGQVDIAIFLYKYQCVNWKNEQILLMNFHGLRNKTADLYLFLFARWMQSFFAGLLPDLLHAARALFFAGKESFGTRGIGA